MTPVYTTQPPDRTRPASFVLGTGYGDGVKSGFRPLEATGTRQPPVIEAAE